MKSIDALYELAAWLDYIKKTSGVHVIISGLVDQRGDPALQETLLPHLWHLNPYCLSIKEDRVRWDLCIRAKQIHYAQMKRCAGQSVCSYCPFGVFEVSWPVLVHGRVVGSVSASTYRSDLSRAYRHIDYMSAKYAMDAESMRNLYQRSMLERGAAQIAAECQLPMISRALTALVIDGTARMTPVAGNSHALVDRAIEYIFAHAGGALTVPEICRYLHVSESHMQHLFKRIRGQSMVKTIMDTRLQWARTLLRDGRHNVQETAQACGFSDPNYFSTVFARRYGLAPSEYKKQNERKGS